MISTQEIKFLLNDDTISDEDIIEIKDNLYGLAEIAIEQYLSDKIIR